MLHHSGVGGPTGMVQRPQVRLAPGHRDGPGPACFRFQAPADTSATGAKPSAAQASGLESMAFLSYPALDALFATSQG